MMSSQPPPVIRAAQAAYLAQDCLDRVHDLTSLETAGQAINHYSQVLAQTSPLDQKLTKEVYGDIPSLSFLLQSFKDAGADLCRIQFSAGLAHVS